MTMRERAEAALSAWVSAHGPGEYLSFAIAFAEAEVRAEREALDARLSAAAAWTESDRLRADGERTNVLAEEARRRVPQLKSIVMQSLGAVARTGLDARPAVAALDGLLEFASAYPAAKAKAEVDAERDTNERLTDEVDRLRAERDEAVGLIGALANHLESAVAIMTDCYVLYEDEAADERELVAEARAFLDRTAPAKEPSE